MNLMHSGGRVLWWYLDTRGGYGDRVGLFFGFAFLPEREMTPPSEGVWAALKLDAEISWAAHSRFVRRSRPRPLRLVWRLRSDARRISNRRAGLA